MNFNMGKPVYACPPLTYWESENARQASLHSPEHKLQSKAEPKLFFGSKYSGITTRAALRSLIHTHTYLPLPERL